ncbi:hypothetical protein ACNKHN_22865 [Shigella flexneri]
MQALRDWGVLDVFTVPGKGSACLSPSSYLMLNRYWVSWMAVV